MLISQVLRAAATGNPMHAVTGPLVATPYVALVVRRVRMLPCLRTSAQKSHVDQLSVFSAMSGAVSNGHVRNSSRSSVNTITGSGAAAVTSPGGSGGAFSRAASIAKRTSVAGKQTPEKDGASDAAAAPPSPSSRLTPRARRAPSTSMARKGSTSSSTSNSANESSQSAAHDSGATSDDAAGVQTELSRMSRDQLVALIARERTEREEVSMAGRWLQRDLGHTVDC